MTDYEAVIGLEVHVQLKTESKVFCGCPVTFGAPPNTAVCPVCLGLPGSLPVLNEKALRYAVLTGMMLGGRIAPFSKFDRKNYFYPDLPKNYQISQYDLPLCSGGSIEIEAAEGRRRVGITRVHLEEDAGKLVHSETPGGDSSVDFNRTGVPLLEIVSEPELSSPDEACAYLKALKLSLQYLGVSDCDMEKGSLRCDANVSVRPRGARALGVKVEVKNMNSFRAVGKALAYEIERQTRAVTAGERVAQETRLWEADSGMTHPMRSKEEAHDYRYFPEPDLAPVVPDEAWLRALASELPEAPRARRDRFVSNYGVVVYAANGISEYDAEVLTAEKQRAEYFEALLKNGLPPKTACNWLMGETQKILKEQKCSFSQFAKVITPAGLAALNEMVEAGSVSGTMSKSILLDMLVSGMGAAQIVEGKGLTQISDTSVLTRVIDTVLVSNPKTIADYRAGKKKALDALVGQVMRETKGKANPKVVRALLMEKLP